MCKRSFEKRQMVAFHFPRNPSLIRTKKYVILAPITSRPTQNSSALPITPALPLQPSLEIIKEPKISATILLFCSRNKKYSMTPNLQIVQ